MSEEDESTKQLPTSEANDEVQQEEEKEQENVEDNEVEEEIEDGGSDQVNTTCDDLIAEGNTIETNTNDTPLSDKQASLENDEISYEEQDVDNESTKELDKNCLINEETGELRPVQNLGKKSGRKGKGKKHRVTMTVTIAAAIPTSEEDGPKMEDMVRKKKRLMEAPKAQNYYHCSYYLLPDDTEPIKTDVVTFGMAAKIYTDHDSKVIKTWQEGQHTWVAWSHSQKLNITKDLLLKLFDHTLQLRIWESREKVSARARFDRPKVFRLPQAKPGEDYEDVGGVRSLVMKQSQSYIALQPKKSFSDRPMPQNLPPELKEIRNYNKKDNKGRQIVEKPSKDSIQVSEPIKIVRNRTPEIKSIVQIQKQNRRSSPDPVSKHVSPESMKSYKKLGQLAGTVPPEELKQIKKELKQQKEDEEKRKEEEIKSATKTGSGSARGKVGEENGRSTTTPSGRIALKDSPQQREARRKSRKVEQAAVALQAYIKQHYTPCFPLHIVGLRSITNRLDRPVPGIEDVFITVSLDGPLMSESLRQELNPLVIKIASATNLPDKPLSYEQLDEKCLPVYCMYKFMGDPPHITSGKEHGKNSYWEDTNVVLLGNQETGKLREYLNGPPLQIEVHDRDRTIKEAKLRPTLFGEDMEDDKIGNVGMVTGTK
ncbi:uncharacterized protein LOC117114896 [Anneissia japonica]|uniref:uncharacterized protein LOC117114896 n=1 Tax=Anneissia japonica TaxID=1529436 RepID=UPI0014257E4D|nr:uncharacterized protein LOC117114896 [Anneissia japonica]